MALFAAAGRIATTVASMAATRVELAAVEIQQEARSLLRSLAWTVLAACLAAGAVLLAAVFVILLFWDSYPLQAVAGMAIVLGVAAAIVFARVRAALDVRPALLSATLAELRSDLELVRAAATVPPDDVRAAVLQPEGAHD